MGEWRWEAEFHGSVHTATLAVVTVLALFVLVLGSFGNSLVLLSAFRRRKKGSGFDLLLLNLCAADLLLCVVLAPLYLYTLFADPPVPQVFCGSVFLLGTGLGLLSLLSIVAIAIHRQARVAGRAKHSLSPRQTRLVLGVVWLVSGVGAVGATLPAMLGWRESYHNCQVLIYSSDPLMQRFTLFFLGPVIVVSFVIIIVSYVIIARAVRAQSRARVQGLNGVYSSVPLYRGVASMKHTDPVVPEKRPLSQGRNTKEAAVRPCRCCSCQAAAERESKAVTMCIVVMVSLVLCWSPLLLSQLMELFTGSSIVLLQVKLCGIALVFLNSALDPYMYAQTQGHARSRYGRLCWDVLHCQCSSPRRTSFRTLRTRPVPPPRSSLLEVDTPVLFPSDRRDADKRGCERVKHRLTRTWKETRRTRHPASQQTTGRGRLQKNRRGRRGGCEPGRVISERTWQTLLQQQTLCVPNAGSTVTKATITNTVMITAHSNCQRVCRTADVVPDITTVGHKSWCPVHVSSDQSLVES